MKITLESTHPTTKTLGTFTGSKSSNVLAGQLNFSDGITAFCLEPSQTIRIGETVDYVIGNAPPADAARIFSAYLQSEMTALDAQAAQWAIWEVVIDGGDDLSAGLVRLESKKALALANDYLATYGSYDPLPSFTLHSATRQDMLAIPDAHSVALGLIGLVVMVLRRRRKYPQP